MFDKNEDVTSKSVQAYMDFLNKLTGIGDYVFQFFIKEEWDQDLDKDDKD